MIWYRDALSIPFFQVNFTSSWWGPVTAGTFSTHWQELTNTLQGSYMWDSFKLHWSNVALTHWDRDKMAAVWQQTTFSNVFSWMKMYEFQLKFHWNLFLRVQLTIFPALFQIMDWRRPGGNLLSEPIMVRLQTHICITRPHWVNTFRPELNSFHIADIFKEKKIVFRFKFCCILFVCVEMIIVHHWFR